MEQILSLESHSVIGGAHAARSPGLEAGVGPARPWVTIRRAWSPVDGTPVAWGGCPPATQAKHRMSGFPRP